MSQERIFYFGQSNIRAKWKAAYQLSVELVAMGGAWELIVRPRKSKRSIEQNRRLWALLREVSANVWLNGKKYSDEVWHEHFKRTLIGCNEIELPDGTTELRGISTTTLSVAEFGDYMTQIEAFCAEQGCPLMEVA